MPNKTQRHRITAGVAAAIKTVWRWSALYCRGAPVGSEAPGGNYVPEKGQRLANYLRRDETHVATIHPYLID